MVGQPVLQQSGKLTMLAPNLVEGRELWAPQGIAVDNSASPPILYVADFLNNRVLAWKNANGFQKGDPADLVIGQRDKYSTGPKGPGTDLSMGLTQPTGIVVDSSGNLYVADTGNSRIVRYPAPFRQTTNPLVMDLIIGQKDLTGRSPNQGNQTPSETTLSLQGQYVGMTFDSAGNLWVSDANNNRVLRYPAAELAAGAANDPAADLVLGQPDFVSTALPKDFNNISKNALFQPGGLAFSPQGELFVVDSRNRVLVYAGQPFTSGQNAARIMGVIVQQSGAPPIQTNEQVLGSVTSTGTLNPPLDVFFVGNNPFVVDTGNSRIVEYDPFKAWPTESATLFSPSAIKVFGQPDFKIASNQPNQSAPGQSRPPTDNTFSHPSAAVLAGSDLLVVDSGNNRVVAIPQFATVAAQAAAAPPFHATRLLGQVDFQYKSINLVEGREFFLSDRLFGGSDVGGTVAVDTASATPHLYVADVFNNRILGFKDARSVTPGQKADLVIGQPDLFSTVINYSANANSPSGNPQSYNDTGLFSPNGVAVDSAGNLWVADTGNGRVLRFPKPFDQPQTTLEKPDLVLGKPFLVGLNNCDASQQNMCAPYGLAFSAQGDLVVSDVALNRILWYRKPTGADFTSGQSAENVIGQNDFASTAATQLNTPHAIALDANNRVYVADTGNNRIVIYANLPPAGVPATVSLALKGDAGGQAFNKPFGVTVDPVTEEVWVADTANSRVVRFPDFDSLTVNPVSNLTLTGGAYPPPLSIALDAFGNPIVADEANRVVFYYRLIGQSIGNCATCSGNAANYFYRFSPGMLATIKPSTNSLFGSATATNDKLPVPTALGDVEVLVGGVAAPLLYVSPAQINLQIPSATPVGAPVEFDVIKVSTGQILATGLFQMEQYSPGLFSSDATGTGQLAVVNQDGTINGSSHPAKAGSTISLYGTGEGPVPGAPPDGQPAQGIINTPLAPVVFINATQSTVTFSGLAPGFVGLWQINVVVPSNVPPGNVNVVVAMGGAISTQYPLLSGSPLTTSIAVAPQ